MTAPAAETQMNATAPRIRTTVVGSYPVPDWLVASPSEQALVDATRVVIGIQEQAGIDVVCDGELSRFDIDHPETNGMIEAFIRPLDGISPRFSFEDLVAYRASSEMKFRTRPRGRSSARSAMAASTCRSPARAPGPGNTAVQVHDHRPAHAGQDTDRSPLS